MEPARRFLDDLQAWLRERTASELVSREEAGRLLADLRQDEAFWSQARPHFDRAWKTTEDRLRGERRGLRELLSPEAQARLLDAAEAMDPDPEAVRTFLRAPAIETMLGSILYAGIFEFMKKADLLGALVNKLPVIGPIRKRLVSAFAEEVEGRLEGHIKAFLGTFSGLAVERMIQFVLSDENREGFRKARRRLAEHLLERPVTSLLPDAATTARWRDVAWGALRDASLRDEAQVLAWIYEDHGAQPLGAWAWEGSPLGRDLLARGLARFLEARGWSVVAPAEATRA
ncbi:MAG: hypothetical protein KF878_08690 [Planctomycetes bacterium]|nr:hypothetical protein [Planctomycetota bacterium]